MRPHTEESGQNHSTTLVMVHGAGGSTNTWFMQKRGLSKALHTIAIDLNGHGQTQDKKPSSIQSYIDDVDAIVSDLRKPFLMGHSMGGAITQLYALQHPEQVSGIILVGTGAKLRVASIVFDLLDNDFEAYLQALGDFMFHTNVSENMIEAAVLEVQKCPVHVIRRDWEYCDSFDIMERVSDIGVPTLIIVGADDLMTPPKYARYLHDKIEGAELKIIEKAGHSVMLEQPKVFNRAVIEWIEKIASN